MMLNILLIEDNLADQRLAIEAFRNARLACRIEVASDGRQALVDIMEKGERGEKLPDLILLDLNLPRIDGRQILHRVKSNPKLRGIPVLILSSSSNPKDIAECYELQANCYLIKPMEVDSFFELIQKVEDLWFLQKGMPNSPVRDQGCYGHSLVASSRSIAANA